MNFLTELNEQAEKVCKELLKAKGEMKKAAERFDLNVTAYHKGRAEELEKWLASLENMITKIVERK